jgi:cytochrome c oxidase subunit 3
MPETHSELAEQFEDLSQQRAAGTLGMWVFLSTEVMFFGVVFAAYTIFRLFHSAGFAEGSRLLDLPLGAINTAILLSSSLTMALAVHSAQTGKRKLIALFLLLTMLLGLAFLGIKFTEYAHKFEEHLYPGAGFHFGAHTGDVRLFLWIYFTLTALHALHMIIGIGMLTILIVKSWQGKYSEKYYSPLEFGGLYWHFIDIVWIFLFPLLYLIVK